MFKVGTMLKAREVRLSRKKPPYHPALIPGTSDDSHHLWGRLVGHTVLCGSFLSHRSSMQRIGPYDHPLASRCPAHASRGAAGASLPGRPLLAVTAENGS